MPRRSYNVAAEKNYLLRESTLLHLLSLPEPLCCRLYLLVLSMDGECEIEQLASLMELSLSKTEKLLDLLETSGVFSGAPITALSQSAAALPAEKTLPPSSEILYTQSDIKDILESDGDFKGLVSFSEKKLGRVLGSQDLIALLRIYRHIGFSAGTICLLVSHVLETFEAKYEGTRRPTFRHIEKEAILWDKDHIDTPKKADVYIKEYKAKNKTVLTFLELFEYRGDLSPSIEKYVLAWDAFGFSKQMLLHAFDLTVLKCGKLEFKYLNTILCNWHKDGITALEDLEQPKSAAAPSAAKSRKAAASSKEVGAAGADELASLQHKLAQRRAKQT